MKAVCPNCKARVEWDTTKIGPKIDCPTCGVKLEVDDPLGLWIDGWNQKRGGRLLTSLESGFFVAALIGGMIGIGYGRSHPVSGVDGDNVWFFIGALSGLVYCIPSFIAVHRKHRQVEALMALNIFGGLIFVGWVAALVWALIKNDSRDKSSSNT